MDSSHAVTTPAAKHHKMTQGRETKYQGEEDSGPPAALGQKMVGVGMSGSMSGSISI